MLEINIIYEIKCIQLFFEMFIEKIIFVGTLKCESFVNKLNLEYKIIN